MEQKAIKLLDKVKIDMRTKHYNRKIEDGYLNWIKRFNNKTHPENMGADEIRSLLIYLAVEKRVASSTNNQFTRRQGKPLGNLSYKL